MSTSVCCIKCARNWRNLCIVILHIIGKHHKLCNIQEPAILPIIRALVHALIFCLHSLEVVRNLDFAKGKGQSIDKHCDIRPKTATCR